MINKNQLKFILPFVVFAILAILLLFGSRLQYDYNPDDQINQTDSACYIANCHGLEIECGPQKAEICTMEYAVGDACRKYAECAVVNNNCQPNYNDKFNACKSCVLDCKQKYEGNPDQLLNCETTCADI
ncbi:MAG: hypothetical protein KatS3mg090_0854 [Patescibacteria group bacterium]|nr:MAG: hypothetical protein KatS3mg090_0854 [Patescibacteria group bacterium]